MAKLICIMGESGSGKTTSMRTLDPKTTMFIDCDKKGLSWKGWRKQYSGELKNYIKTDSVSVVESTLRIVAEKDEYKHIKTVVVDTLNGLMVADEMRRSKEKGYDKWVDLAASVWDLINNSLELRDDLTIIFTAHTDTERDDSGLVFTRIKTNGKKLNKIVLESKFTTVLLAKVVDGEYKFETQANNSTAKSPMGAFDEPEIPNDMKLVLEALKDF